MIKLCEKCGTPKQKVVPFEINGHNIINIHCKCEIEEIRKEEQAFNERQKQEAIKRIYNHKLFDNSIRDKTFANAKSYDEKVLNISKRYVGKIKTVLEKNYGLLFWGDYGTGKTFYSACIVNALIEMGYNVLYTSTIRLINEIQGLQTSERTGYIDSLNSYQLIVLDDLGNERTTESANEILYQIINGRYCANLPLIVNTNLSLDFMKNCTETGSRRIYERIVEKCVAVKVENVNARRSEAIANKSNFALDILED